MTRARKLLVLNCAALVASLLLWVAAAVFGWLASVTFVSHVSMLALVLSAISGIAAGDAAVESESEEGAGAWGEMPAAPTIDMQPGPDITGAVPPFPVPQVALEDEEGWRRGNYL